MAKLNKKIGVPMELEVNIEVKKTLGFKVGFILIRIGAWIIGRSAVKIKVV